MPRLPVVKAVPIWWWLAADLPIVCTALCFGWQSRRPRELLITTLAAACGWAAYIHWAAVTHQPGYGNQPLPEVSPLPFWTLGLLGLSLMLFPAFAIGAVGRRVLLGQHAS